MYLPLHLYLPFEASLADVFVAALTSPEAVNEVLPNGVNDAALLQRLYRVSQPGPLFLDFGREDTSLSDEDIGKIGQAIRQQWHRHGFSFTRSSNLHRWVSAAGRNQQPLLYWHSLSPQTGYLLLGSQLHVPASDVFRFLTQHDHVTVEEVAHNPTIFSQRPRFSSHRVQMDIAMGRIPRGPIEDNRMDARRILGQMQQQRLVVGDPQRGLYAVVRPMRS